jgi:hypothetical protein
MLNDEKKKKVKKMMLTHANPLISWPESFDQKQKIWKNLEAQLLTNQMLNAKIKKNK